EGADVYSKTPAIDVGRGSGLRVVAVAAHQVGTAYDNLAGGVCPQVKAHVVNNRNSRPWSHSPRLPWKRRKWGGCDLMGRFGRSICFQHGGPKRFSNFVRIVGASAAEHERVNRRPL